MTSTGEWGLLIGIPALWVLLFLLYGLRVARYGRYHAAQLERRTTSALLPRPILEFGYWLYAVPVRGMARLGVTANMLTLASLGITLLAAVLIAHGRFAAGGWVLLASSMPPSTATAI